MKSRLPVYLLMNDWSIFSQDSKANLWTYELHSITKEPLSGRSTLLKPVVLATVNIENDETVLAICICYIEGVT